MEEGTEGGQEDVDDGDPEGNDDGIAGAAVAAHRSLSERSLRLAEPVLAALVALWFSRAFWLPGRHVVAFDTVAYTAPNYRVTMDAWRAGRLPLWNDLIFGGVTHAGNPQAGVFAPTKLIGLWFDTNRGVNLTVTAHLVVMAVGTVLLLRRLGARPPAGLLAAVVMVGGGATLTRSIQFEQIIVLAWAPLLLWGITGVLAARPTAPGPGETGSGPGSESTDLGGERGGGRPWGAMAATGAVTSMVLVSGHPQLTYQVIVLATVWTVPFAIAAPRRLLELAAAVATGVLASAVHLLAALAATRDSAITAGRDLDELASPLLSARPEYLPQILLGTVRRIRSAEFAGGFESIGHVGVAGATLAVIGMVLLGLDRSRRPLAIAIGVAMVLTVVWALGPRTPLFLWAYDLLPGFDLARGSARWLSITTVLGAIAAGLGADALARHRNGWAHLVTPVIAMAVVLLLGASGVIGVSGAATVVWWLVAFAVVMTIVLTVLVADRRGRGLPAVVTVGALTVVPLLELGTVARNSPIEEAVRSEPLDSLGLGPAAALADEPGLSIALTDDAFADIDYLIAGHRPNTNVLAGVASLDGYDGGVQVTERFAELIRRISPAPEIELPLRNNLPFPLGVDLATELGLRWTLVDDRRDAAELLPGWESTELSGDGLTVWENPAWIGDAVMIDADGLVRAARLDRRSPAHLIVDVTVDPAVAIERRLIVHRQTAPGWRATVDGRPTGFVPGDGFFLTLDLPAGAAEVELSYRPRWLLPGLIGSAVGIALLLAMTGVPFVTCRRPGGRTRAPDDRRGSR